MREMLTPEAGDTHWLAERRLAVTVVVVAIVIVAAGSALPAVMSGPAVLGLPFGLFLGLLGAPLALLLLAGVFLLRQGAVDETYDAAEE